MLLQGLAPSSPAVAAPAKETASAAVGKSIRNADALTPVKIPCGLIGFNPPALEQAGFNAMFFQFQRK